MKTKLIIPVWLLFASMLCNVPALQMYAQSTDITSAQREVSKLSNQKKSLTEKYDKAKLDYEDAQAKVKTNQDKPNSLAYKSAVKKTETSKEKMSSIQAELNAIDQELTVALKNLEQIQQQQLETEALEKAEKEKAAAEKQARKDKKREEREAKKARRSMAHDNSEPGSSSVSSSSHSPGEEECCDSTLSNRESQSSNDEISDEAVENFCLILLSLFILWIVWRISKWVRFHKCSKCKRHRAMKEIDEEDMGVVKKKKVKYQDGSTEWIYRKYKITRECKHCGHQDYYTKVRKED